jgi:decaprenylphospho-beta-D-ribofuranose 2-oxidase
MQNILKKNLSGWSEYKHYSCEVFTPTNLIELQKFLINNNKKIIARGHGCSNGDQSVLMDGIVVDMNNLNKIISYDYKKKKIEVEAGTKLTDILLTVLKDNLFLPSTPGGLDITVAGAVSNNIHGKDCFKNGYFENNVNKIKILSGKGEVVEISRSKNEELFRGIFSSQGLLGIIYSVELELKETINPILEVETKVANNLSEMKDFFENIDNNCDYAVAWLDCGAKKKNLMRGIFSSAKFVTNFETNSHAKNLIKKKIETFLKDREKNVKKLFFRFFWMFIGKLVGSNFFKLFNPLIFNIAKFIGPIKKKKLLPDFLLLEEKYLPEYKYLFKKKGFLNIQPFFDGEKPFEKMKEIILICQKYKILPIWCPIKKYKKPMNKTLTFGGNGYSIVIEFSPFEHGEEKTKNFIFELKKKIEEQGGKFYLAKDAIIDSHHFKITYPEYKEFLNIKKKYDPDSIFVSEQFKRLFR